MRTGEIPASWQIMYMYYNYIYICSDQNNSPQNQHRVCIGYQTTFELRQKCLLLVIVSLLVYFTNNFWSCNRNCV